MSTIGERLSAAIERMPPKGRQRGVRLFQREMEERREELRGVGLELWGTSYPSIWSYLKGRTTPPTEFIREAANVLGVREAWLARGEGPIDAVDAVREAAQQDAEMGEEDRRLSRMVEERIRSVFPGWDEVPAYAQTIAWQAVGEVAYVFLRPGADDPDAPSLAIREAALECAAETLASALTAPLVTMPRMDIPPATFGHYMVSICSALLLVAQNGTVVTD